MKHEYHLAAKTFSTIGAILMGWALGGIGQTDLTKPKTTPSDITNLMEKVAPTEPHSQAYYDQQKVNAHITAGIIHYKTDSAVLELIMGATDDPRMAPVKKCNKEGWPDDCAGIALGMVKTLRLYLDNKIPGMERPPFLPQK